MIYEKTYMRNQSGDSEIVITTLFSRVLSVTLVEYFADGGIEKTRLHGFRRKAAFISALNEMLENTNNDDEDEIELPPAQPWPWAAPRAEDAGYSWLGRTKSN